MEVHMVITEVFVRKDCYVLIVWILFHLIVWSVGEGICSVCCLWFIFELDIILGNFWNISHNAWSNLSWFPVVLQVCVVCIHQNRDFSSFKQV